MSQVWTEFNAVFWTGIATMSFGFFAVLLRYAFLSKCDQVSLCCGLINIHRAVEFEEVDIENKKENQESKDEI
jgi:hypothetical protein